MDWKKFQNFQGMLPTWTKRGECWQCKWRKERRVDAAPSKPFDTYLGGLFMIIIIIVLMFCHILTFFHVFWHHEGTGLVASQFSTFHEPALAAGTGWESDVTNPVKPPQN